VWFDSLGKPWPKHECYYANCVTTRADKEIQDGIDRWLRKLTHPLIGVVTGTTFDQQQNAKYAVVKCSNGTEQALRVYVTFSVEGWNGEMVIFSKKDGILIRPYLSLETVISLEPPPPPSITNRQRRSEAVEAWRMQRMSGVNVQKMKKRR